MARWMCDVSDWDPQDEEIEFITNSAVTKGVIGSQEEVYKFDCSKDRAFALAGIALKNRCCVDVARVPSNQVLMQLLVVLHCTVVTQLLSAATLGFSSQPQQPLTAQTAIAETSECDACTGLRDNPPDY